MAKKVYILFLVVIGFFLMPTLTYACGSQHATTTKKTCQKDPVQKKVKDCCKNPSCKKHDQHKGCDGSCKDKSCCCASSFPAVNLSVLTDIRGNFAENKKQKFPSDQAYISSGFYSIWLPPKIS